MTEDLGQVVDGGVSGRRLVSLVIPCKAEYVGLCRLVAGVLGARESLDDEVIADLKLVVTEACTSFVWGPNTGSIPDRTVLGCGASCSLQVDFNVMHEAWEIVLSDPDGRRRASASERCGPMNISGLGLSIIRALVDTVEQIDSEEAGSVLRLVKRLQPRPEAAV
ncbi:MAG: hypothetical protein GX113_05930 [Actinobacteria bacterium]|jgi:anti-sigma regulatory factor (Ser/Thr protein kinase)|nr:hypothetical protein [Actinomycetota bacterium]